MNNQPKIILYISCSLDSYIARTNGDIDWCFTDQDYGYKEFINTVDTLVMGRKTYEQLLSFGEFPYTGKACFVFSRTKPGRDENAAFYHGSAQSFISEVTKNSKGNIWLVGGGEIIHEFLQANLIDEFKIFIHPIILGEGIPLFFGKNPEMQLKFTGMKRFNSGLIELKYRKV